MFSRNEKDHTDKYGKPCFKDFNVDYVHVFLPPYKYIEDLNRWVYTKYTNVDKLTKSFGEIHINLGIDYFTFECEKNTDDTCFYGREHVGLCLEDFKNLLFRSIGQVFGLEFHKDKLNIMYRNFMTKKQQYKLYSQEYITRLQEIYNISQSDRLTEEMIKDKILLNKELSSNIFINEKVNSTWFHCYGFGSIGQFRVNYPDKFYELFSTILDAEVDDIYKKYQPLKQKSTSVYFNKFENHINSNNLYD